jgi:hypothetical protein
LVTIVEVHEQIWRQSKHTCWNVAWIPVKLFTPRPAKSSCKKIAIWKGPETQTNGTNFAQRAKKTDNARRLHLSNGIGYSLNMKILSL